MPQGCRRTIRRLLDTLPPSQVYFPHPLPPRTPATSPAPIPDPDALHAALTPITFSYDLDMAGNNSSVSRRRTWRKCDGFPQLHKAPRPHDPRVEDGDKIAVLELSLKTGSYARSWFKKLPATDKDTFKHLEAAFMKQWPEKEMAVKEKGELQEELLRIVLPPRNRRGAPFPPEDFDSALATCYRYAPHPERMSPGAPQQVFALVLNIGKKRAHQAWLAAERALAVGGPVVHHGRDRGIRVSFLGVYSFSCFAPTLP
ncbi:hypothetical protein B0H14DRAFT_3460959 [Mycena olivaceomarginata]|nr:hypothetical protein B0H14DRAFT_3460959 [Mycena olivaceomarginata]